MCCLLFSNFLIHSYEMKCHNTDNKLSMINKKQHIQWNNLDGSEVCKIILNSLMKARTVQFQYSLLVTSLKLLRWSPISHKLKLRIETFFLRRHWYNQCWTDKRYEIFFWRLFLLHVNLLAHRYIYICVFVGVCVCVWRVYCNWHLLLLPFSLI